MKPAGRRRGFVSWFVEPYRQVKLGLIFIVLNILFSLLILAVFGYYIWDMYVTISTYFDLAADGTAQTAAKLTTPVAVGTGLILLFVVLTLMISVRYTHQIYGPLVSIHRYLDGIINGTNPEPLQLRESDQLQELAEKLNSISERLSADKRQGTMIPVYRFLDDLIAGKHPDKLQLREQDQLSELVEKLNQIADRMNAK